MTPTQVAWFPRQPTAGQAPPLLPWWSHRPPWRHRHHWHEFDQGLDSWLALSPVPVVLMLDNNSTRRPNLNARWRWHGAGIDGVLTDLPVRSVLQLHQRRSDHAPVSIAVRIPRKRSPQ